MATATTSQADRSAICNTVLDYFEGWFEGDALRMERALHPQLAKRSLAVSEHEQEGPEPLDADTAQSMIEATARGVGARAWTDAERRIDIDVEDVYGSIASVTVSGPIYHEYLHLVRTREGWKIANALWQRTLTA